MECLVCERIKQIHEGKNPYFIRELKTGYVVLGDVQLFEGYTLFLYKDHIRDLHLLPEDKKQEHLYEMSCVEKAVYNAFKPDKMNIESLGNSHGHLHWHFFPRNNSDMNISGPVWYLGKETLFDSKHIPDEKRREELKARIAAELERILPEN